MGVHGKPRPGQLEQTWRQSHVIGMHVCEEDFANIGPAGARCFHAARQRLKASLRPHAAVDQQIAIGEPHQVYVDRAEREGKRKTNQAHARQHFAAAITGRIFWRQARC